MIDHKNHYTKIKTCNCRQKYECSLNKKCCTSCVIYKATINNEKSNHIGMAQGKFKDRFTQPKHTFKNELKKQDDLDDAAV